MRYKEELDYWLESDYFDTDIKAELEAVKKDEQEIEDRFYKDLEFGTGGLRGVIGAGTNRINIYTIRKATQGLSEYLKKNDPETLRFAEAYAAGVNEYINQLTPGQVPVEYKILN